MPGQDDDLLARLNALKPSSVSFKSDSPSIDVEVSKPQSVEDRLAERLKGLRSSSLRSPIHPSESKETADSLTARVRDEVATKVDPIKDWQESGDDGQNLEELLAEIGPEDQWKLDPDDSNNVNSLLLEARAALPPEREAPTEDERPKLDQNNSGASNTRHTPVEDSRTKQNTDDQQDEEEADDYVKRILCELEMEKKYGVVDEDNSEPETTDGPSSSNLELPSTPSNLPPPPASSEPPSYEDSELETRFSKLGLNLPSTPKQTLSSKAKANVNASLKKAKAKSSLPKYADEDVDSWCCICNEDGEVRCLGCDGDIYCQNCWQEGHGDRPGQERGHRAVQYNKQGPAAGAA